ncbi:uncharacterized protein LOC141657795 [Silene latifolia]|uniref:uncharacterized protein LOC141657795 n=1 Tax=Silene latifolia TaxID=37657 RepID=UPI003D76C74C
MEESREVQCEENKAAPEKNKAGRQFKTPEQLQGLENFYNEHKYPTESMKAEIAVKLNLTEKQVSGWFCHRRLKDKRALEEESQLSQAPQKPDLSSGVIQDRASGLKQDSCSSTKQADHKRADLREVESWRYHHENIPDEELNYQQRSLGDGNEIEDTSSESNSALQESFYPQISRSLPMETTEFRASNGFIQPSKGRVGPSGYLKIKGLTENAAITAVKRQLGRHYREDGPSLGIEFDPLPPEAFESLSRNINEDFYGVPEHDISGAGSHKHPRLSMMRNEKQHEAPAHMYLQKSDPNNFSFHQPKQKFPFPNQYRTFPDPKSSFGIDSRPARDNSDYSSSRNLSEGCKNDLVSIRSDSRLDHPLQSYGGKVRNPKNTLPVYGNVVPKVVRQKEQLFSRPAALADRHNDLMYIEDRLPPFNRDEEVDVGRRHTSEHNDLVKLKMRPTNELRANKRGREEVLEEDYAISASSQDPALWSKQMKGPMEMPSSFSEDETAETSSSMEQGL